MCRPPRAATVAVMTATAPVLAPAPAPAAPALRRWTFPSTLLAAAAVVGGASLLVSAVGLGVDHRVITGAPAWQKPLKFSISVPLYLLTLRWMLSHVSGHRRVVAAVAAVSALGLVAELVLIDLQVVRGTTSHFNTATPFDAAVFDAMGVIVAGVFVVCLVAGVLALRQRGLDAGLAAGIRWGIAVSLVGMAEAGTMIANQGWDEGGGHTVGAPDGGPGLPLTDWSTLHGDLRIGHFVGLHALQALPLLAWVLARRTGLDAARRARLVAVAGCAQAGLVVVLTAQALRGRALLHPDAVTLTAAGVLVLAIAGAAAVVLRGARRPVAPAA
jgi:hypothetical protein